LQAAEAEQLALEPMRKSLNKPIKPESFWGFTGSHPAFVQMVMDSAWNSWSGDFTPDLNRIRNGLHPYYADLWQSRTAEECALLLKLAGNKPVKENSTLVELRQRGLVSQENKLFCQAFSRLIVSEWLPKGKSLEMVLQETEEGLGKGSKFFNTLMEMAKKAGQVKKAFVDGGDSDDDSKDEERA
jgi:hypothetical protein